MNVNYNTTVISWWRWGWEWGTAAATCGKVGALGTAHGLARESGPGVHENSEWEEGKKSAD